MEQPGSGFSEEQRCASDGNLHEVCAPEWQLRAIAGPALLRLGDRVLPASVRLGLDYVAQGVAQALGSVVRRAVQLRVSPVGEDSSGASDPGRVQTAFSISFEHPALGGEVIIGLSLSAARAVIDPLCADLADLRGYGELSAAECGLLEYVALAVGDRVLQAMLGHGEGFVFTGFAGDRARSTADGKPNAPATSPAPVDLELVVGGRRGIIQVACDGWTATETDAETAPFGAPASAFGDVDGDAVWVTVRLALPAIPLSAQEFRALGSGDIVLLGRTTLKSFASTCSLITTTGWELGPVELCDDTPTVVSVRCRSFRPTLRPELLHGESAPSVALRPAIGVLRLTASQLARCRPGDVVDLPTDPVSPVELYKGLGSVGRGELVTVEGELGIRLTEFDPHAKQTGG
ncbi:MAG: FliM/FliN family flagellar motor switch protein [Phycisphaerae bacterium]